MSKQIQFRRGTTAEHSTFTGAVGEMTIDTDKDTVVVHDGATAGGNPLATSVDLASTDAGKGASLVGTTADGGTDVDGALLAREPVFTLAEAVNIVFSEGDTFIISDRGYTRFLGS